MPVSHSGQVLKKRFIIYILKEKNSQHRLFYCYANNIENDGLISKSRLFQDDIIFIDYVKLHDNEDKAANNYNKQNIDYLYEFQIPNINNLEETNNNLPNFWFRLTEDQNEVLMIEQPASIKGSAGTGKTFISFELLKHWIISDPNSKLLYLTYTEKLLEKGKKDVRIRWCRYNERKYKHL